MASPNEEDPDKALFEAIGLAATTAEQSLKNPKFRQTLKDVIHEAGAEGGCPKERGALLYMVAGKFPASALTHRPELLAYIMGGRIKANPQVEGALEHLKAIGPSPLDAAAFEAAAGVGVEVTAEEVSAAVAAVLEESHARLVEDRYHFNTAPLFGALRQRLKWAEGKAVKNELDRQVAALLGHKTEADSKPREKKKKEKKLAADGARGGGGGARGGAAAPPAGGKGGGDEPEAWRTADPYAFLPGPHENNVVHTEVHFSDQTVMRVSNSAAQLAAHLQRTGGKVITRFPPEPNGYLHIGHAKAMFVDFGMAQQYSGSCYLRFDDTNPAAEKQEYIDHIQDIVGWMGWQPWKVTYSSDYFERLHELAVELIKRGKAFVCHQTSEEIYNSRVAKEPSPWRERSVDENLRLFDDMRRGLVEEGKATLRMKMDYKNENVNMFDQIAYRIKFCAHPKAGDAWCIYPSYDFTHCLVDAMEDISHSLCTLEFESRRASYYWLLEVLDTYKPLVWEYSRLNITHNVLSKRKLQQLVVGGYVDGWDDPRLLTLAGLRRRGVTPQSINNMCREIGITRNEVSVHLHKLDHHVRQDLDAGSRRALAVLRPLRVVLTNMPADKVEQLPAKVFPGRSDETYDVPFSRVVYIERTDFREQDAKDYYGLAPGKSAMLRYAYPIKCTGYSTDPSTGEVTELAAEYDPAYAAEGRKPPKGVLNWVAQPAPGVDPPPLEARLYDVLFVSEDPGSLGDAWLADLNPASKAVLPGGFASPALAAAKPGDRFQLERLGYFCVDPDSGRGGGPLVANRTCTLKESFPKFG